MREITPGLSFIQTMQRNKPDAMAWITGDQNNPDLSGLIKFYSTNYQGIFIEVELWGLPNVTTPNSTDFYAMHIHENGDCSQNFTRTGNHYSYPPAMHPSHSGDLVPLLGNQGYAFTTFYDNRLTIPEIIGRSVIIHSMPDDFHTQPSGNSGQKIACGEIRQTYI